MFVPKQKTETGMKEEKSKRICKSLYETSEN